MAEPTCCLCRCCMCLMTMMICYSNMGYCVTLAFMVGPIHISGYIFVWVFFLWNFVWFCKSCCCNRNLSEHEFKTNCYYSCLSVMALMATTFTLITRYYYFDYWPKHPNTRERTTFLSHKMGLVLLVSGIPIIYGCELKSLMNDKKMIYKVIVDFIDIYEMAEVLDFGAPKCTSPSDCIPSKFSAMREGGWLEISVQIFCSISFLVFYMIYREAINESEHSKDSLKNKIWITRLLQDVPFFVIRALVWILHGFDTDQFIFLIKNVISGALTGLEFYDSYTSPDEPDGNDQTFDQGNEENQRRRKGNRGTQSNARQNNAGQQPVMQTIVIPQTQTIPGRQGNAMAQTIVIPAQMNAPRQRNKRQKGNAMQPGSGVQQMNVMQYGNTLPQQIMIPQGNAMQQRIVLPPGQQIQPGQLNFQPQGNAMQQTIVLPPGQQIQPGQLNFQPQGNATQQRIVLPPGQQIQPGQLNFQPQGNAMQQRIILPPGQQIQPGQLNLGYDGTNTVYFIAQPNS